jgi:hypothetical protein
MSERAANSVRSLSPFGERMGVRGLQTVLMDPKPLTHSFMLQKGAALSDPNSGLPEFGTLKRAEVG